LLHLAFALASAFDLDPHEVRLNDPFKEGRIVRSHGMGRIPWVQVEMNRALYLDRPWFDEEQLTIDSDRLTDLRTRFHRALVQYFSLTETLASGPH
jgi:formiminoglutamase